MEGILTQLFCPKANHQNLFQNSFLEQKTSLITKNYFMFFIINNKKHDIFYNIFELFSLIFLK